MCVDDHIHGLDLTNTSHLPTGPSTQPICEASGSKFENCNDLEDLSTISRKTLESISHIVKDTNHMS